jgi:hypothetical protein
MDQQLQQVNLHGQQKMRQATAAPRKYDGQQGNLLYDSTNGGHYGMSSCRSAASRDATRAVASTIGLYANSILQAHPHPYVVPAHPRFQTLIFGPDCRAKPGSRSRAVHRLLAKCTPLQCDHSRDGIADDDRSTKGSRGTTAIYLTRIGSSRSPSWRRTNTTTSCTSSRSPASRRS